MRTRKSNKKFLIAGGLIAAIAASSGAFTASLDVTEDQIETAAAGDVIVDGGRVVDVDYSLDTTNGATVVDAVTVTFRGVYAFHPETYFRVSLDGNDLTCPSANGWSFVNHVEVDDLFWDEFDTDATVVTCTGSVGLEVDADRTHIVVHAENPVEAYAESEV